MMRGMDAPLAGKTMFISGATRGIGLAIALRPLATAPTWR
jgi:NAD(P)-dependent dehydrogenase (short-subunit alcohol dehydrogenase family)